MTITWSETPRSRSNWKRIPLEGTPLREVVHFACPKDPEGTLVLGDGRAIELPFEDIEVVTSGAVRMTMRVHGDSSYLVRYSGSSLTLRELWVRFDSLMSDEQFNQDIDAWVAEGCNGSPGYAVDTRMALAAG